MKKVILGSSMVISGVLGFAIWALAASLQNEKVGFVLGNISDVDWIICILFLLIAIIGTVISIKVIRGEAV